MLVEKENIKKSIRILFKIICILGIVGTAKGNMEISHQAILITLLGYMLVSL